MLDPAQNGIVTPHNLPPCSAQSEQSVRRPNSTLATHHSSLQFLIASPQNIRIHRKPLKTKNGDLC